MKKIGMRTIKTGISVTLGVLSAELGIIQNPILTVSACIMSMKSTVRRSLESGFSRILGTLLGGFLGFLFAYIFNGSYLVAGLGVVLTIHFCYIFKFSTGAVVSSLTFISISMGVGDNDPLAYSIARTIDTMFGVIISLGVNYWISRKKYINYLYTEFMTTEARFLELSREISRDHKFYMYEDLQDELEQLNEIYDQIVDEIAYYRKDGDLSTLKISVDLCTQIFYHLYGMHINSQQLELNKDVEVNKTMQQYHKKCIRRLLYEVKNESDSRCEEML